MYFVWQTVPSDVSWNSDRAYFTEYHWPQFRIEAGNVIVSNEGPISVCGIVHNVIHRGITFLAVVFTGTMLLLCMVPFDLMSLWPFDFRRSLYYGKRIKSTILTLYQISIFGNKMCAFKSTLRGQSFTYIGAHISIFMLSKINFSCFVGSCKIHISLLLQYFFVSNITRAQIQYKDVVLRI